jgi:hypothetical protein
MMSSGASAILCIVLAAGLSCRPSAPVNGERPQSTKGSEPKAVVSPGGKAPKPLKVWNQQTQTFDEIDPKLIHYFQMECKAPRTKRYNQQTGAFDAEEIDLDALLACEEFLKRKRAGAPD